MAAEVEAVEADTPRHPAVRVARAEAVTTLWWEALVQTSYLAMAVAVAAAAWAPAPSQVSMVRAGPAAGDLI